MTTNKFDSMSSFAEKVLPYASYTELENSWHSNNNIAFEAKMESIIQDIIYSSVSNMKKSQVLEVIYICLRMNLKHLGLFDMFLKGIET